MKLVKYFINSHYFQLLDHIFKMPIASSDVVEAFDDLGYTVEDPKVIDRLCSLCDNYDIDQDQVSCQYLAFAKKHKLNAPTLTIIDQFENDVIKGLKAKSQENAKNHIYDSSTIHEINRDNDEDDILDAYGTPKTVRTKRQMTPESGINKHRLGTTLNDTFSPESLSQTPHAQGKKYGSRDNAGKVLIMNIHSRGARCVEMSKNKGGSGSPTTSTASSSSPSSVLMSPRPDVSLLNTPKRSSDQNVPPAPPSRALFIQF